jgi:hypothetical protein
MLTSYLVTCPHDGCHWFGSLLPSDDPEAWRGSVPTRSEVVFRCPQCHGEWRARVVGDDVVPLPLEPASAGVRR